MRRVIARRWSADATSGTGDFARRNEPVFDDGLEVSPGVRVTSSTVDPDRVGEPFRPKPIHDVLVVGAKLSVGLFTLAGLAERPGGT